MSLLREDELVMEGYNAFWDGFELCDGPDPDTDAGYAWAEGWNSARKRFELRNGEGIKELK